MASYLIESAPNLYLMNQAGVATQVTLPMGVTLLTDGTLCEPVVFGSGGDPFIIVVNGLTQDIFIDTYGTARQLQLQGPSGSPTLSAGASTGLNGVYMVAVTFKVKDANGKLIIESPLGPNSVASASLVNQTLLLSNIPVSSDGTVTSRGIYRTLSGGNVLYPWFDIDDNVTLSEDRDTVDSLLSILPTDVIFIGSPPDLSQITTWKDRLWAVEKLRPDFIRWTEERIFYAWGDTNEIVIPPANTDTLGVTAFIPRRDQLGIARRNRLYQITGDSNDTFQRNGISETIGCVSQESVVIIRDVAYWLGDRGVVEWTADSLGYVSEAQVNPWFMSDTYFNRSLFPKAQGRYNPDTDSYELLLASANSTTLDKWVAFDLKGRRWFGPHKTAAATLECCGNASNKSGTLTNSSELPLSVFGGADGYLYYRDSTTPNDYHSPVALNVDLPYLGGLEPDLLKVWNQPLVHTRAETSGTLTITPTVGNLGSTPQPIITHDMTLERERLPRLGTGRYAQLNLSHSQMGEKIRIYGLTVPYSIVGNR